MKLIKGESFEVVFWANLGDFFHDIDSVAFFDLRAD